MRIGKQSCGCETATDRRDREVWIAQCSQHKQEFDVRHAAAALSCSHVNRDLIDGSSNDTGAKE